MCPILVDLKSLDSTDGVYGGSILIMLDLWYWMIKWCRDLILMRLYWIIFVGQWCRDLILTGLHLIILWLNSAEMLFVGKRSEIWLCWCVWMSVMLQAHCLLAFRKHSKVLVYFMWILAPLLLIEHYICSIIVRISIFRSSCTCFWLWNLKKVYARIIFILIVILQDEHWIYFLLHY